MSARLNGLLHAVFGADDASDVVRERQFQELKELLPVIYSGLLICSMLVATIFFSRAPLLVGALQAALAASVAHRIFSWLRADPAAAPIDRKKKILAAAPPLAAVFGLFCTGYAFALDAIAADGEKIIVLMWVAFCGVGVGMSLAPLRHASRIMMLLTNIPYPAFMLVTGALSDKVVAALVLASVPIGIRQYWRMGELLERITRQEADAERQREHARNQLRGFMEMASDWAWETDADFRLVYASPRLREVLGREISDLIGKPLAEAFSAGFYVGGDETRATIREALRERRNIKNMIYEVVDHAGAVRTVSM
ncbi:MAG: PAS domain-containing protein [Parvularculaceae bacterium]